MKTKNFLCTISSSWLSRDAIDTRSWQVNGVLRRGFCGRQKGEMRVLLLQWDEMMWELQVKSLRARGSSALCHFCDAPTWGDIIQSFPEGVADLRRRRHQGLRLGSATTRQSAARGRQVASLPDRCCHWAQSWAQAAAAVPDQRLQGCSCASDALDRWSTGLAWASWSVAAGCRRWFATSWTDCGTGVKAAV